jgi:hypothetical protein
VEADPVEIPRASLVEACRQLEVVVPSLDRIGSAFADDPGERAEALRRFIEDWEIAPRLAKVRGILSSALDAGLTEDESLRLDDHLTQSVWEHDAPDPPIAS